MNITDIVADVTSDSGVSLLRPGQVASRLSVSRQAVYKWIAEGSLECVRLGDNAVRVHPRQLAEFLEKRKRDDA